MPPSAPPEREPIAIVGITALYPGSTDSAGFWRDILAGRDLMTDTPANYWLIEDYYDPDPKAVDKTYAKRGAFLSPVEFDALEFGLPPHALSATDTGQLLALIGAKRVLEDAAAGRAEHVPRDRVSVILGGAGTTSLAMHISGRLQRPAWVKGLREAGLPESEVQAACDKIAECYTPFQENTFPGMLGNVVAGRIANRFNLGGSNFMVDAACAGSLAAISVALNELYLHQADMVITGGVDAMNDILMFMCFSKTPALSASGDCRPFSDNADGTMLGEGLSMFALRRLSDAERDGDKIYAVIRGLGSSSDGRAKSVYAPRPEGQSVALRRAYTAAGFGPETVELVEAHGTGTFAGDAAEFAGLRTVFEEAGRTDRQWCALGSVKSQIGHTKGASGAAGLFKVVMALHHKVLPPTIKVDQPNPKLTIEDSPFYLNTEARPWLRDEAHPRRAGVSSFGFGGTNFHMVLEEYVPSDQRAGASSAATSTSRLGQSPAELLIISAETRQEVALQGRALAARLVAGADWRHLAAELQDQFDAQRPARLALVAESSADAQAQLAEAVLRLNATGETRIWEPGRFYFQTGAAAGAIAFLFAGQGSQYVGMGADLAMTFAPARAAWDQAETLLQKSGSGVRETVFPRPVFNVAERTRQAERLTQTEWAQPALAVSSLAHLAILSTLGILPDFTAGHSFGELLALHAAGMMDAADLLRTAQARGALMAAVSSRSGAMTAVSCPVAKLRVLLAEWNLEVVLANHNSPSQAVLSGSVEAMVEAERRLSATAIPFQRLRVSAAFHSPLIAESAITFGKFLESVTFSAPKVPVFSNSEAAPYPADSLAAKQLLAGQLARPVRFAEQIEALYERGARIFIELGAGATLTKLTDQCLAGRDHLALALEQKGKNGVTALWHAVGQLAVAGVPVRFAPLRPAFSTVRETRPARASASTFAIDGSGFNRPYPPRGGASARPAPNPERKVSQIPTAPVPTMAASLSTAAAPPVDSVPPRSAANGSPTSKSSPAAPQAATVPASRPAQAGAPLPAVSGIAVDAWRELQAQIGESQKAAQAAIVESLSLTLNSLETLARGLAPGHHLPSVHTAMPLAAPVPSWPAVHDSLVTVDPPGPIPRPAPLAVPALEPLFPSRGANGASPAFQPAVTAATPLEAPVASGPDLRSLLLEVVAEKTGYPADVLDLDMELESGLGIDSIKRVEIFSTIQERATGLPQVTAEHMASLRTLREIITFLGASPTHEVHSAIPTPRPSDSTAMSVETLSTGGPDLQSLLLEVVAEKTGYPVDVLDLDMELESGLGIDSIKRVEIFSTIQERATGLPQVTAEHMASLRTLREIITFLGGAPVAPASVVEPILVRSVPAHSADAAELPPLRSVREIDRPAPGLPMPGLFACESIAVTDDGAGIAPALVARLADCGILANVVKHLPASCPGVIFLGGLQSFPDAASAIAMNAEAFRVAKSAAQQLDGPRLFVAVQDAGGDFGLSGSAGFAAWSGGIAGIIKTAAGEWPDASCKVIDLEKGHRDPELLAAAIVDELFNGADEVEVGLRACGRRTTLAAVARSADGGPAAPVSLNAQSVIVASGGGRGVTAACLIELARTVRPRIALLGRTVLEPEPPNCAQAGNESELKRVLANDAKVAGQTPDLVAISRQVHRILAVREIHATVAALERAGSPAIYLPVNVQDAAEVSQALHSIRKRWGPITGLVHGAGILADRKIADKTAEQFQQVFDTKVLGLRALLDATATDPLNAICLFSSVAARFGNAGQCDYAAANEVLNKVASLEARRRGPACRVKSLNWGPLEGGMVTPSLAAHFRNRGIPLIPIESGSQIFVRELCGVADDAVEIVIGSSLEGPLASGCSNGFETELLINARTYPLLNGHRIKEDAVLAAVVVMEWFFRAAAVYRPHFRVTACRDFRVLKGVVLPRFEQDGHWLRIVCREEPADSTNGEPRSLHCELHSRENQLHYSATVELCPPGGSLAPASPAPVARTKPNHTPLAQNFYEGDLFHGPEFQVLHSLDFLDEDGAHGKLLGHTQMNWQSGPWKTEAAGCDGALQLVLLWGRKHLGGPSLPTRIGRCIQYEGAPANGFIHSVVRCRKVGNLQSVSDVFLRHPDGRPIADLFDVEMHLIPESAISATVR